VKKVAESQLNGMGNFTGEGATEMGNRQFGVFYKLLIVSMAVRLFWITIMEPRGARKAIERNPALDTVVGVAANSLPYIVYPSILILMVLFLGVLLKRHWGYVGSFVFGAAHLILVVALVAVRGNPGFGPLVVVPACLGMMIFAAFTIKTAPGIDKVGSFP
jgi:hypothetical protein